MTIVSGPNDYSFRIRTTTGLHSELLLDWGQTTITREDEGEHLSSQRKRWSVEQRYTKQPQSCISLEYRAIVSIA